MSVARKPARARGLKRVRSDAAGVPAHERVAARADRRRHAADPAGGQPPRLAEAVAGAAQRHVHAVGAHAAVLEPGQRRVAAGVGRERGARRSERPAARRIVRSLAEAPARGAEAHGEPRLRRASLAPGSSSASSAPSAPNGAEPGEVAPGRSQAGRAARARTARRSRPRRARAWRRRSRERPRVAEARPGSATRPARRPLPGHDQRRVVDERVRRRERLPGPRGLRGGRGEQQQGEDGEGRRMPLKRPTAPVARAAIVGLSR